MSCYPGETILTVNNVIKCFRLSCLLEAPGEEGEAYLNISLPGRTSFTYRQVIEFKVWKNVFFFSKNEFEHVF